MLLLLNLFFLLLFPVCLLRLTLCLPLFAALLFALLKLLLLLLQIVLLILADERHVLVAGLAIKTHPKKPKKKPLIPAKHVYLVFFF